MSLWERQKVQEVLPAMIRSREDMDDRASSNPWLSVNKVDGALLSLRTRSTQSRRLRPQPRRDRGLLFGRTGRSRPDLAVTAMDWLPVLDCESSLKGSFLIRWPSANNTLQTITSELEPHAHRFEADVQTLHLNRGAVSVPSKNLLCMQINAPPEFVAAGSLATRLASDANARRAFADRLALSDINGFLAVDKPMRQFSVLARTTIIKQRDMELRLAKVFKRDANASGISTQI